MHLLINAKLAWFWWAVHISFLASSLLTSSVVITMVISCQSHAEWSDLPSATTATCNSWLKIYNRHKLIASLLYTMVHNWSHFNTSFNILKILYKGQRNIYILYDKMFCLLLLLPSQINSDTPRDCSSTYGSCNKLGRRDNPL